MSTRRASCNACTRNFPRANASRLVEASAQLAPSSRVGSSSLGTQVASRSVVHAHFLCEVLSVQHDRSVDGGAQSRECLPRTFMEALVLGTTRQIPAHRYGGVMVPFILVKAFARKNIFAAYRDHSPVDMVALLVRRAWTGGIRWHVSRKAWPRLPRARADGDCIATNQSVPATRVVPPGPLASAGPWRCRAPSRRASSRRRRRRRRRR